MLAVNPLDPLQNLESTTVARILCTYTQEMHIVTSTVGLWPHEIGLWPQGDDGEDVPEDNSLETAKPIQN